MKSHFKHGFLAILLWTVSDLASGAVVISEIMYHPLSKDDRDEYVELHNTAPSAVDVSGWCFDGIAFCFPAASTIPADAFIVLSPDPLRYQATYAGAPAPVGTYTLALNDGGERLALFDAALLLIDEVIYQDDGMWPVTPDSLGPSLEVIDPSEENGTPRNWRASLTPGGSPGATNSVDAAGLPPWIELVAHTQDVAPGAPIVVDADVVDATSFDLIYRLDFDAETTVTMSPLGGNSYSATIPGQASGTLVRYRLTASGTTGAMAYPRDDDTVLYDGTAVIDPALSSAIPILHWFMDPLDYQDALDHKLTDDTEPVILFYDGRLYDNVQARLRGQSARFWDKPPWKFFMPQGHKFTAPDLIQRPVDTFNLQSTYSDKTHLRERLGWESFRDSGSSALQAFSVRVEQNGAFFGLYTYLEAPDADWIERSGLSRDAAYYKAVGGDCSAAAGAAELEPFYEKRSRTDEDHTDLFRFTTDLNTLQDESLRDFIFDNIDLPTVINYIAVQAILHNNDNINKNFFLYRDTLGSGRWSMYPWDLDLTFGRVFQGELLNDEIWADRDSLAGQPVWIAPSHPLVGTADYRPYHNAFNRCYDTILTADESIRRMYFRRLRTLIDLLLADGRYEARIATLQAEIAPEAALDRLAWTQWGDPKTLAAAIVDLENLYLDPRRVHLYTTHAQCDIPGAQPALPRIVISEIMFAPPGGSADEFIELYNPSTTDAVDLSGWRVDGVALTIPAGTVLLPQSYLVLAKNDFQFRASYGGGKFVAAEYEGSLNDLGESLVLRNQFGGIVNSVAYEATAPWPGTASGSSLELIDPSQENGKVVNWAASPTVGGTPGAENESLGLIAPIPSLFINEVLPDNVSINSDEQGEFDDWVEIYNASSDTIDLSGMFLTDDLGVSNQWQFPPGSQICGGCWLIVWADNETTQGPLHANFALAATGGSVGLFAADGTIIDHLNYGELLPDFSYGRFQDGGSELRVFSNATPSSDNTVPITPLLLNEYNAVAPTNFLDNGASDSYWGRVQGNGGDWFELVVTEDHLDLRGWELAVADNVGDIGETNQSLFFSADSIWSDLRAGTIITVSEELPDDVSYDPQAGDWWINVRARATASGIYITAQDFEVTNTNWQLTIKDDQGAVRFGPAGEGIHPVAGIGGDEVFKLEQDPSPYITQSADYNDGTSSTFGAPNVHGAGAFEQDFTSLRIVGLEGACTDPDFDVDGTCDAQDNCPVDSNPAQVDLDGDGLGDACDGCPDDADNDADADGVCGDVDNCPAVANPSQDDAEPDGVGDLCDNCVSASNAAQQDSDLDGLGDACDSCVADPLNDADADAVCDGSDNCPGVANASQIDTDQDDAGNACDSCPLDPDDDIDFDGICGEIDTCPAFYDPGQADLDGDGSGEPCDNCPALANAPQTDTDGDGIGDACDPDDDNDGIADAGDNCPLVANDQSDADGNGQGDACQADDDADGIADAGDNCPRDSNSGQLDQDGDGDGDACDCALTTASVSQVAESATSLRLSKVGGTTLSWRHGAQGHTSHVYRGFRAAGQPWPANASCFDAALVVTVANDPSDPPSGTLYYYRVSGENVCGESPAGYASDGSEDRPLPACASTSGDTDGDGRIDLDDNCSQQSNAAQVDTDQDFLGDDCDNCSLVGNADQLDTDENGAGDACDADDDGDGIPDVSDNCPLLANAGQADGDGDTVGDLCDPCTDSDGDGLGDPGIPGGCGVDLFPVDPENDADNDGLGADSDNCADDTNADQIDSDADGIGEVCDACPADPDNDIDGDGICAGDCGAIEIAPLDYAGPEALELAAFGSPVRYLANLGDPGLALSWTWELFDDSAWSAGTYGLGYEADAGAENLISSPVPVGTRSIYARSTFEIADVGAVTDLFLGADYDDGCVAWINGIEVFRSFEMPGGTPLWDTIPSVHESSNGAAPDYGELIDISAGALAALHNGTNVLAIGVWNRVAGNAVPDDLVLVPQLVINRIPTMKYLDNGVDPGLGLDWTEETFDDSSWSSGSYGVGYDFGVGGGASGLLETTVPAGAWSIYTRARFSISDPSVIDDVILGADYDDGFAAWINGTEVLRSSEMPAGIPVWNASPGLHESSNGSTPVYTRFNITDLALPALHAGTNVLAIGVWNQAGSSSDLILVTEMSTSGVTIDNCPFDANPDQADGDSDGVGDACDNCPADFNPLQTDANGNAIGDSCEAG